MLSGFFAGANLHYHHWDWQMIEKYGAFFNAFRDKDIGHETGRKDYRQLEDLLGENGVLIMPSHPTTAPYHYQPLLMPLNFAYTAVLNVLGVPVTACPIGTDENANLISVQIAAIVNNERLCLNSRHICSACRDGCVRGGRSIQTVFFRGKYDNRTAATPNQPNYQATTACLTDHY
ncbi:fatty-acid amide hydrolase 2-B [Trichinella spiralis]|uniref:fatty-acid amide hydrolase 2-B n=1 Tax=Trichinella spiralis TaxID=6334 RepID=UPI0001EFDAF5|nr:fatty-acid amide hydrolase 2-B [Trichinella spiralis]